MLKETEAEQMEELRAADLVPITVLVRRDVLARIRAQAAEEDTSVSRVVRRLFRRAFLMAESERREPE